MSRPHFVRETWPVHPAKRCRVDGGLGVVVVMFRCGSGSALIWFCGGLVYVGIERSSCRSGGIRIVTDLPMVLAPAFARLILARRQFFPLSTVVVYRAPLPGEVPGAGWGAPDLL